MSSLQAIFAVQGQGEQWRLKAAVEAWDCHLGLWNLLVAGSNSGETTHAPVTLESMGKEPYRLDRTRGVIIQGDTLTTKTQAEWFVDEVNRLGLTSCAVFASPYHTVRIMGTILAAFDNRRVQPIVLIPMLVHVSPFKRSPETGRRMIDLMAGELARYIKYQKQGDVVTLARLIEYLEWLYEQPVVKNALYA